MAKHEYPPKGFGAISYPLPQSFEYLFTLQAEGPTKDATILTFIRSSEVVTAPEAIEVNPSNTAFAEDVGPLIAMNSIVPKVTVNLKMSLTKAAIETDSLRTMTVKMMPIYSAFLDGVEAIDTKTNVQIEDILELQHETGNKDVYPLFSGTDLGLGTQPLSNVNATEVFGDMGLSVDTKLESVAFDESLLWDALRFYSNRAKLQKAIGKVKSITLSRDRPFRMFSDNFTYPMVKRGNPYTFCGLLIWIPQVDSLGQVFRAAETTAIEHLYATCGVHYSEWNADHDQTAY